MQYSANISWNRHNIPFNTKSFDRTHTIQFASGTSIQASSAPEFAGNAALPNPEELFVASISSCFMLTFLYLAAMKGLNIDAYKAEAVGTLAKNSEGKMAVTEVTLTPTVTFQDNQQVDSDTLNELFKKAHDNCFISCSVKTKVVIAGHSAA